MLTPSPIQRFFCDVRFCPSRDKDNFMDIRHFCCNFMRKRYCAIQNDVSFSPCAHLMFQRAYYYSISLAISKFYLFSFIAGKTNSALISKHNHVHAHFSQLLLFRISEKCFFFLYERPLELFEVLHSLSAAAIPRSVTCFVISWSTKEHQDYYGINVYKTLDVLLLISLAELTVYAGSAGVLNNKIRFWDLFTCVF